jgi:hypothetical protein
MKRILAMLAAALMICALIAGCNGSPKDSSFTSKSGLKLDLPPAKDTTKSDSARKAAADPAKLFGFSVKVEGAAEVHFYDSGDRHTGPARSAPASRA